VGFLFELSTVGYGGHPSLTQVRGGLLAELGIEVGIGDAAKIKTKRVCRQKTDRPVIIDEPGVDLSLYPGRAPPAGILAIEALRALGYRFTCPCGSLFDKLPKLPRFFIVKSFDKGNLVADVSLHGSGGATFWSQGSGNKFQVVANIKLLYVSRGCDVICNDKPADRSISDHLFRERLLLDVRIFVEY